jgi:hypothetical protein
MCAGAIAVAGRTSKLDGPTLVCGYGSHSDMAAKYGIGFAVATAEAKMIGPGVKFLFGPDESVNYLLKNWERLFWKTKDGVISYIKTHGYDDSLINLLDDETKKTFDMLPSYMNKATLADILINFISNDKLALNWTIANTPVICKMSDHPRGFNFMDDKQSFTVVDQNGKIVLEPRGGRTNVFYLGEEFNFEIKEYELIVTRK